MKKKAKIYYYALDDFWRKEQKLEWLKENKLKSIAFETITPDKKNNWINLADNDWEMLLPLVDKKAKSGKEKNFTVFKIFSTGFLTGRDDWVTDFNKKNLLTKIDYYLKVYNNQNLDEALNDKIKWSRNLKRRKLSNQTLDRKEDEVKECLYRPYTKKLIYDSPILIDERGSLDSFFLKENVTVNFRYGNRLDFCCIATEFPSAYAIYSLDPSQYFGLYYFDAEGNRRENITDWALEKFQEYYRAKQPPLKPNRYILDGFSPDEISKIDIFQYVYAVLHDPAYRRKYELNLKRDFPRIPFYDDFKKWKQMGGALLDLHLGYEKAEKYPLERKDASAENPNPKLRTDKEKGIIYIDSQTTLYGVPSIAWEYKLGNRSALEWILDQYKEKKPKDATIAEKFNNYRFADYKEQVIELLQRVCTVSVKTMEIVGKMETE